MPARRLVLWTALVVLILTGLGVTQPFDEFLRTSRNYLHRHQASGDVVLVAIDDHSLATLGRWPWPRRLHAGLVDRLTAAGAKNILFDITLELPSDPVDDKLLTTAIARSQRVTLALRGPSTTNEIGGRSYKPFADFARYAQLGSIAVEYNFQNAVWKLPYATTWNGALIPSYAAILAGRPAKTGEFTIDYSVDPATVPAISASKVVQGRFDPRMFAGKSVIIGPTTEALGDQYYLPGLGKMGGAYVHVLGAETIRGKTPINLGWFPGFVLALALSIWAVYQRRDVYRSILLAIGVMTWLILPIFLDSRLIFAETVPGLLILVTTWSVLGWRGMKKRGLINSVSGLPNLNALRSNWSGQSLAVIACRVMNYEEIVATLQENSERQLVEQIVSRLTVGAPDRVLYQGDSGIFAWFEKPDAPFRNHLDALYSLFRNPARVNGAPLDLAVAFGVELGGRRSLDNRLASALVAAEEAAHDGLKWKYHDPETLEDASWKLSMLSQLDSAIDEGQVWVAYQPKLELATRRIIGAEALARWTHPEKGPIAATEFVAAAEQQNRIGKLTDFVLTQAVRGAAEINKRGIDFDIAVNLSARLLSDKGFTLRLSALLARHGLAPGRLILELTETAALAGGEGIEMIARLRDLGVRISIDDYGTGLSTLDYLKKIPAHEIKIDQSFVKGMLDSRSDRVMVQSTIGLAHSLERKVVAEGVEHREILDLLIEMDCDIAQGFAVGRPMSLETLARRITAERKRTAA